MTHPAKKPDSNLRVRPLTGAIGAEVIGVDLNQLTEAEWHAIEMAWYEYLVLFFPGQSLEPASHIAFASRFGVPEVHPFLPKLDSKHPEIVVLDSEYAVADFWHTDLTFTAAPPSASILNMVKLPSRGGDTLWLNQYSALAGLAQPMRDLLSNLSAVHRAPKHPEHEAVHPAVMTHPETGRQYLFVNEKFTSRFVDLSTAESEALLKFLFEWVKKPEFQCRYRWDVGTVAVWDNRCTQHYAVNDYDEQRIIQRVTAFDRQTISSTSVTHTSSGGGHRGPEGVTA